MVFAVIRPERNFISRINTVKASFAVADTLMSYRYLTFYRQEHVPMPLQVAMEFWQWCNQHPQFPAAQNYPHSPGDERITQN
jgi:hypothetical protein